MKVRVRYSKQGNVKFIGHLDIMRYFMKLNRRAGIDVAYSEGFSPHQIMSFAAPLSLGFTSNGEYFDMKLNSTKSSKEMIELMNKHSVDDIRVLSFKQLDDNAKNCMSILAAATYKIFIDDISNDDIDKYMSQSSINAIKKTKKGEKEIDIKPLIYDIKSGDDYVYIKVSQGSSNNLKPSLVTETLLKFLNRPMPDFVQYERLDMFFEIDQELKSLEDAGYDIE